MSQVLLRFLVSPCRVNLAWLPAVLCLGGWLIDLLIIRRFVMPDVLVTQQALSGVYTDWYAPIHAAAFRLLLQIQTYFGFDNSQQGLPYLCYIFVLWGGLFLVLHSGSQFWKKTAEKPRWQVLLILLALFSIWSTIVVLSKTTLNVTWNLAVYLLAVGLLLNMPKRIVPKIIAATIVLIVLFFGTALRHNLLLALFPLLCWLVWSCCSSRKPIVKIVAISTILWGGYIVTNNFINYTVLKAYRMYVLQERFYADIFMLNWFAPHNYKNPPNTFGNNFNNWSNESFRKEYDVHLLYVQSCISRLNNADQDKVFAVKEYVKIVPENEYEDIESKPRFYDPLTNSWTDNALHLNSAPMQFLNEREVLEQYPKDYILLRNAWIERVKNDLFIYIKIKMRWWLRLMFLGDSQGGLAVLGSVPSEFYPLRLGFGGLTNGITLFCTMCLLCVYTFSSRRLDVGVFPSIMLAWSAVLTALPLIIFMPDTVIRYLYWFYAASFISIAYFLAHSPLFAAIMQTIQQYLEEECNAKT